MAPLTEPVIGWRQRALDALVALPPFSPVFDRLMSMLADDNVSLHNLAALVETDIVIAGNVLKLVNSALYGRPGTVSSISDAVAVLGMNRLRNAVFAVSVARAFSRVRTAPSWSTVRFVLHSVASGLVCDNLARRAPVVAPEGAFVAGLFHDIGQFLIAVSMHEAYEEINDLHSEKYASLVGCEIEVIGISHPELSADALTLWHLPEPIREAARFHHSPERGWSESVKDKFRLAQVVACADAYLEANGLGVTKMPEIGGPVNEEPFAPLGIELAAADFLESFQHELDTLADAFHLHAAV